MVNSGIREENTAVNLPWHEYYLRQRELKINLREIHVQDIGNKGPKLPFRKLQYVAEYLHVRKLYWTVAIITKIYFVINFDHIDTITYRGDEYKVVEKIVE